MPRKNKDSERFKETKNKQRRVKYTFSELESLIKKSQQIGKKKEVKKWKSLYRQKLTNWNQAWKLGQQKLIDRQKALRVKKEVRRVKEESRLQRKKRLGEIYHYFRQELNKLDRNKHPEYFTAHLFLDPETKKGLKKLSRQYPEYDFYAEFRKKPKNLIYQLNKGGRNYLLKQTAQAYQEEVAEQEIQIRYWQERAGLTKTHPRSLIKKGQKIKFFFPEKGEHKDFFHKKKEFQQLWQEILTFESSVQDRTRTGELSKELYLKSPWRIRDRFVIPISKIGKSRGMQEIYDKYYRNNPFTATRKYYLRAISNWLNSTTREGEPVSDSEIELDRYGKPRFKEGQTITLDSRKPGRSWSVYKNVPSWEEKEKKRIHDYANEEYITNEGTELEIQVWKQKKDKALCWVEEMGLGSCKTNQGTSAWFCLDCVNFGYYHPPILPKHCNWQYTYKNWLCGSKTHSDANKQWHFSMQGERIRERIKGGDWGNCHIGTFSRPRKKKSRLKNKNWVIK